MKENIIRKTFKNRNGEESVCFINSDFNVYNGNRPFDLTGTVSYTKLGDKFIVLDCYKSPNGVKIFIVWFYRTHNVRSFTEKQLMYCRAYDVEPAIKPSTIVLNSKGYNNTGRNEFNSNTYKVWYDCIDAMNNRQHPFYKKYHNMVFINPLMYNYSIFRSKVEYIKGNRFFTVKNIRFDDLLMPDVELQQMAISI